MQLFRNMDVWSVKSTVVQLCVCHLQAQTHTSTHSHSDTPIRTHITHERTHAHANPFTSDWNTTNNIIIHVLSYSENSCDI